MHLKLVGLNCRYTHSCLALFYVRQELDRHLPGCRISLEQYVITDPYHATLLRIAAGRPAAIFFSVYLWNSDYVQRLTADLRRLLPESRIVWGGPQATYGEAVPDPGPCTLVRGPVEGLSPSFYTDLQTDSLQPEYRAKTATSFSLPYRPEDFTTHLQNRHLYYESSRGCPFSCSYCLSAIDRTVRHQDFEQVEQELEVILRHRPQTIRFVDRTFNDRPERALRIWRFLLARQEATTFHFEIAPDLFTEEMFELLAEVEPGRFQFEIGLQSVTPDVLEAVHRPVRIEIVRANIERLAALETVHLHLDLILGLPRETRASFLRSFDQVFSLAPHYLQMGLLKLLPGTPLARRQREFDLLACGGPPYEILATRWLSADETAELYWFGECVEAFCNNRYFRALLAYIRRTAEHPSAFFLELLACCRRRGFFERARTQEAMSRLLHELAADRPDLELLRDLLRFDWLASGHRFLPDYLGGQMPVRIKEEAARTLPQNLPPYYSYRERDQFFKQVTFMKFGLPALKETRQRTDGEDNYICFLPQEDGSVFKRRKVVVLSPGK